MAKKIYSENEKGSESLVSELIEYIVNGGFSFFIAPDGSNEGLERSDNCDKARKEFLDWLDGADNYCDYIEIRFGGDDDHHTIERTNY